MDQMTASRREQLKTFIRGISLRQVRLVTGVILLAYLVSHFLNHALGNISMKALATGVYFHVRFWQFPPVGMLFYASCLVHTALGVWALYERRHFSWKAIEPIQLVLGLSIPAMVVAHIIGARLGQALYGHEKPYPHVFFAYWITTPYKAWLLTAVMIVSWVHACLGLHFWLRMKPFYQKAAPFLLAVAVLIPTLSILGLYRGGRAGMDSDSLEWRQENPTQPAMGTPDQAPVLERG